MSDTQALDSSDTTAYSQDAKGELKKRSRMLDRMRRLMLLIGLVLSLAVALPDTTQATSFTEVKKLTASDAQTVDHFGRSVAVSGDTAVVGAPNEDDEAVDAGAAYVFQRDNGGNDNWGEVRKLTASNAKAGHRFGTGVAVSGDTAVVGACCEGAGGNNRGTAYVFRRDEGGAGNWGEVKKLTASDAEDFDSFGISVAASSDIIVVGAYEATGDFNTGAAYMFQRDEGGAGNWGEVKKLTASDAARHDFFGVSVSVSGDTVMVGASRCCRNDNPTGIEGAAYVFLRDAGGKDNWGEVTKLTASDAESGDFFGDSVAVSGDTALIGGLGEDDGGSFAGAAYVFQRDDGGVNNWGEVKKLTASDAEAFSYFGTSVAVSADTALVGGLARGGPR